MSNAFEQTTDTTGPRWTMILRKRDEEDVITSLYAPTWDAAQERGKVQASDPVWDGWTLLVLRHEANAVPQGA